MVLHLKHLYLPGAVTDRLPLRGEVARYLKDHAGERVHILKDRVERVVERLGEVLQVDLPLHYIGVLPGGHYLRRLLVIFVLYVADDLLYEVLERNEPRRAAIFVDDYRKVLARLFHDVQRLVCLHRLGDVKRLAHQLFDRDLFVAVRKGAEKVLRLEDADDVVDILLIDGNA